MSKRAVVLVLTGILIVASFAGAAYCEENKAVNKSPFAFVQGFFMGDDYVQLQSDLAKIEESYKKGEISREKYEEMKADAESNYKASDQR
jgi:hypothetical protein